MLGSNHLLEAICIRIFSKRDSPPPRCVVAAAAIAGVANVVVVVVVVSVVIWSDCLGGVQWRCHPLPRDSSTGCPGIP